MTDVRHTFANLFLRSDLTIGVRLTACFLSIVGLMIAADLIAFWQLRQLAAHTEMLNTADKASAAIVRLHLDVNSFSGRVVVLTRSHDTLQFSSEAAILRETFLRHVQDAEQVLARFGGLMKNKPLSYALRQFLNQFTSIISSS